MLNRDSDVNGAEPELTLDDEPSRLGAILRQILLILFAGVYLSGMALFYVLFPAVLVVVTAGALVFMVAATVARLRDEARNKRG